MESFWNRLDDFQETIDTSLDLVYFTSIKIIIVTIHFYSTNYDPLRVSINGASNPYIKDAAIPEISQWKTPNSVRCF